MDEAPATSAADPAVVEDAAPETEASAVAEAEAEAKIKKNTETAAAIAAEPEKAAETAAKPGPAEEEKAVTPPPATMEEYKDLKAEVKAEAAALEAPTPDLPEEEQAAKEKKEVD